MRKLTHGKKFNESEAYRCDRWLDTFAKVHGQKQQIANSPTESIEVRVANFSDMLRMTAQQNIGKKQNSKSAFDFGSFFSSSLNSFFRSSHTQENSLHHDGTACEKDSEEAQIKKLDKMALGIETFDDERKEKERVEKIKKQEAKRLQKQGTEDSFGEFQKQPRKIQTANARKNRFPFPTSMAKTQKSWHEMKRIQIKMKDKQIFLPLSTYNSNNRFKGLKKTVKDLEYKAKNIYGMKFKRNYAKQTIYTQEMVELNEKQAALNKGFLKRDVFISEYDEFLQEGKDNTVPKFLMRKKQRLDSGKIPAKRAKSSQVCRREYIRMI